MQACPPAAPTATVLNRCAVVAASVCVQLVLQSSAARGNEISLFYHKSESDAGKEPLGEIVLNEIKSVQLRKEKGEGRFDVEVPSRVFALRCDNPAELKKW